MEHFNINTLKDNARIHFIGIGGISMSGLAQIALQKGFKVSGSDRTKSNITDKLEGLGAKIHIGHKKELVNDADLVVHTAAVHYDNPEMAGAKELGIHLIDRAEFLGALMREYKNAVGISGTHGKTTTTSMLAHALIYAETDPTISVGGELDLIDGNIKTGESDYFVTEACEYTNSFLKFFPKIAVITNIEEDHLDFFSGLDEIIESFKKFALLTKGDGVVIANGEDENIKKALSGTDCNIITYGIDGDFTFSAKNLTYVNGYGCFDIYKNNEFYVHVDLNVPGVHNVENCLAVCAVCDCFGIDPETAAAGVKTFTGVHRRFEKKGMVFGATVIDDYAHHPTEIIATLRAAKNVPHNKIRVVFQPHTYTRTKTLWNDFCTCFSDADELILTDIYAAREPFDGITTSEALAKAIRDGGKDCKYIGPFEEIAEYLKENLEENDIIFTMGAGTITQLGKLIVE